MNNAGPIAALLAKAPENQRGNVRAEIAREVERAGGGRARVRGVIWFATAKA